MSGLKRGDIIKSYLLPISDIIPKMIKSGHSYRNEHQLTINENMAKHFGDGKSYTFKVIREEGKFSQTHYNLRGPGGWAYHTDWLETPLCIKLEDDLFTL